MAARRRLGQEDSTTRAAILNAAAKVLRDEGVSALTSRRISQKAGIKSQLIHYYFRKMEDLIVTLMQRAGDEVLKSLASVATSEEPLKKLWEFKLASTSTELMSGLAMLARNNERLRAESIRYSEHFRGMQSAIIARDLERRGIKSAIPPLVIAFLMSAAARQIQDEHSWGMSLGHREAAEAIDALLRQITARKAGLDAIEPAGRRPKRVLKAKPTRRISKSTKG
jgi:TetR/AcrR family transcriptional regulator